MFDDVIDSMFDDTIGTTPTRRDVMRADRARELIEIADRTTYTIVCCLRTLRTSASTSKSDFDLQSIVALPLRLSARVYTCVH